MTDRNNHPKSMEAEQLTGRPGQQKDMEQQPQVDNPEYKGAEKLKAKVAIITGGDSGIGQATAVAFAKEGADIAIGYLSEKQDAARTKALVEKYGRKCTIFGGDIGDELACREFVSEVVKAYGRVDILVNNASEQHPQESIEKISAEQLERTFRSNIYSMFFMVKAVLPYLSKGASIINTTSVTAYKGKPNLIDYSTTKGAIVSFTRSLSMSLAEKGIRVNAVAPGPVWTPLIPSTFSPEEVEQFGQDVPLKRPAQPDEIAPSFVFLASEDSSYISGQVLHPNGGTIVNG